jgi:hypothetical protein
MSSEVVSEVPQRMMDFDRYLMLSDESEDESRLPDDDGFTYEAVRELAECPYCAHVLDRAEGDHFPPPGSQFDLSAGGASAVSLVSCPYCAFWQAWTWQVPYPGSSSIQEYAYAARARNFDSIAQDDAFAGELAQALRRSPDSWVRFDASHFERFVGSILRASDPSVEVLHVGRSGDGGKDLLLIHADGSILPVQVKRRLNARAEPVETVRSLMGVMYNEGHVRGVVVTTANRFTRVAIATASRHASAIRLIDRGKLNLMLSPLLPESPWENVLSDMNLKDAVGSSVSSALSIASDGLKNQRGKRRRPAVAARGHSSRYTHPAIYGPPPAGYDYSEDL